MRSTFVVLASIYAGLVTGFIVPLTKGEVKESTLADFIYSKIGNIDDLIENDFSTEKTVTLDNNQHNIFTNKEAMLELGEDKENIINERSFILLNQRYKKPYLHQVYIPRTHFDIQDRSLTEVEANENYGGFSRSDFESSFKHNTNLISNKEERLPISYYVPPYQYNLDNKGDVNKQFVDEPREYLELLKQPLLRTINSVDDYKEKSSSNSSVIKDNHVNQYYLAPNMGSRHIVIKNNGFTRPYYSEKIPILSGDIDVSHSQSNDGMFFDDLKPQEISRNSAETTILDRYSTEIYTQQTSVEIDTTEKIDSCKKDCMLKANNKISNKIHNKANCPCKRRKPDHMIDFRTQNFGLRVHNYPSKKTRTETSTPSFFETTSLKPVSLEFLSYEDTSIPTEKPCQTRSEEIAKTLEEVLHE